VIVTPARSRRRDFARWAAKHRVRTYSSNSFKLPDDLIAVIPEDLLIGSQVDGQFYTPSSGNTSPMGDISGVVAQSSGSDDNGDRERLLDRIEDLEDELAVVTATGDTVSPAEARAEILGEDETETETETEEDVTDSLPVGFTAPSGALAPAPPDGGVPF
jgi:hypothetical protein